MSVVVRMEMPKNCWVCPFGLDGYIWDENKARTLYVRFCSRHSGEEFHVCEFETIDKPWYCDSFICQLPEGHGRLVDISPLDVIAFRDKDDSFFAGALSVLERIDELPTIVPAEPPKEDA